MIKVDITTKRDIFIRTVAQRLGEKNRHVNISINSVHEDDCEKLGLWIYLLFFHR